VFETKHLNLQKTGNIANTKFTTLYVLGVSITLNKTTITEIIQPTII